MTTLKTPTPPRRLLQTLGEVVAKDPLEETIRLGVGVVREFRKSSRRARKEFEDTLAKGVEARSFASSYTPLLASMDEYLLQLGGLLEELSGAEETPAGSFVAELRLHEKETKAFRRRLAKAISLATQPPSPIDWERLKAKSEADFAAGRFTRCETPEDIFKLLGGE